MNIFVVDCDPATSARMLCDSHVVKMILESCQLLSTAHHVLDGDPLEVNTGKRRYTTHICTKKNICKAAMINHPCNIWTRTSGENYLWAQCLILVKYHQWFDNAMLTSAAIL